MDSVESPRQALDCVQCEECRNVISKASAESVRLRSQLAAAQRERDEARQDSARLDYLDTFPARREYQNERRPQVPVPSDLHCDEEGWRIYVRNLFGRVVQRGEGRTIREAIDRARGQRQEGA